MEIQFINNISSSIYEDIKEFDNYTIYHTKEWHNFLENTFQWKINGIVGYFNNELCFFVPYIFKRRLTIKKINISLPFSHHIGIAYDLKYEDKLKQIGYILKKQINKTEIHDEANIDEFNLVALNYITYLDLTYFNNTDELFKSFDYKSIRYMINKAVKNKIVLNSNLSPENFNNFYNLELETRHRQGMPIYPKNFFYNLMHFLEKHLTIHIAYKGEVPIAGAIFFHFNGSTTYAYGASVNYKELKKLGGNELVLWEGIKTAYQKGNKIFDFGTTPLHLQGLKRFKEKWGGESQFLYYTYVNFKKNININRNSFLASIVSYILTKMPKKGFQYISPILLKRLI